MLALAGSGSSVRAGEYHPGGTWTTTTLSGQTSFPPAITFTSPTSAVGVIRSDASWGELQFTTWTSSGGFTAVQTIGSTVKAQTTPAMVAVGGTAYVVFLGNDSKYYLAVRGSSGWSPAAEPVSPDPYNPTQQSFGSHPASIAALGSNVVIAYAGDDHSLYDQTRDNGLGTWSAAHGHGISSQDIVIAPSIVAPTSGAELMIVYVRGTDSKVMFTTRASGAWSTPVVVDPNALSGDPVSLAALPNGEVMLAYRGQDTKIYWSRYTPGASPLWSQPASITTSNPSTTAPPALAPGAGAALAELVFVNAAGVTAEHARFIQGWQPPSAFGGSSLTGVAVTSM